MLLTLLVFLVILSLLVLIHELGHFLMAKKMGIKVEEFGFGFPPRAFGIKKGETLYSINALPIGGFVKLYGEDEAGGGSVKIKDQKSEIKDINRAFFAKTTWTRAGVIVAGVIMNALLAGLIFYIFLFISGFNTTLPLFGDHKFFLVDQKNVSEIFVTEVAKNSPAEKAGIKPLDVIKNINNQKISDTAQFVSLVNSNKGKAINLSWEDAKTHQKYSENIVPRVSPPKGQGALGVGFSAVTSAELSYNTVPQKLFSGFIHSANLLVYNLDVIGKLISLSIKEKTVAPISSGVAGPVGIYSLVGTIIQIPSLKERVLQILNLAGLLSISLAFFNVLPIPALDGGRLSFILIEAVSGQKVSPKIEGYIHSAGMAILLLLILLITFQDITRLVSP